MHLQQEYRLSRSTNGLRLDIALAPIPEAGADQIIVKIRAVSLNRRDAMIKAAQYPIPLAMDSFVPCSDAAGEVVAVGDDVTRFLVGDRVMTVFLPGWLDGRMPRSAPSTALGAGTLGVLTRHIAIDEQSLTAMPSSLSFEEAATLPCAGTTAWNALKVLGCVKAGQRVLIQGTGGVSLAALQIAVACGAKPIVISSSDKKIERCRAMGAIAGINYLTQPEWQHEVLAVTGGDGVDQVVDVGGQATLARSFKALAPGGHIAIVGGLGGFPDHIAAMDVILSTARISGVAVGSREHLTVFAAFIDQFNIRPICDEPVAFEEAEAAYRRLDAPDVFGNVIVRM